MQADKTESSIPLPFPRISNLDTRAVLLYLVPRMGDLTTETVFGIPYVAAEMEVASSTLAALAGKTDRPVLIAHSDVHVLTRMLHEPPYGEGMKKFAFICPDGMPIVWLLKRKGAPAARLYGSSMMAHLWDKGRAQGVRHFLLGGTEEVCDKLCANLERQFPGALVAGRYCPPMPPWPEGEDDRMLAAIRESGANCVWVGLGCPKQERWLFNHCEQLPPALYFGVGAAFNFHAGTVTQAPPWMRNHGLEWLYRIYKEPRRLFKRYLVHNSLFFWYCLTKKI